MTTNVFNLGDVVLPGAHPHISSFVKFTPPVSTGLVGAYILGGNAELSVRNRADADLPLLLAGEPTISPLFGATVQHANCFDTQLAPSLSRTWIVIYKPQHLTGTSGANRAPLLGNQLYVGPNLRGDQMFMGNPSAVYNQADVNGATAASGAQLIGALSTEKWAASVGIVDAANGVVDGCRRQSGVTTWIDPTVSMSGRAIYTARKVRIGGDGTGTPGFHQHSADVGMVLMHEAALTHTQVGQQLDYISNWLNENYSISDI